MEIQTYYLFLVRPQKKKKKKKKQNQLAIGFAAEALICHL
jgi:preprotein translocase subunit YajC